MDNLVSFFDSVKGNLFFLSANATAIQNCWCSPVPWQWVTMCYPHWCLHPLDILSTLHQWSVLVQWLFTQVVLMRRTGPHPHNSDVNMCCSEVWRTTGRTAFWTFKVFLDNLQMKWNSLFCHRNKTSLFWCEVLWMACVQKKLKTEPDYISKGFACGRFYQKFCTT